MVVDIVKEDFIVQKGLPHQYLVQLVVIVPQIDSLLHRVSVMQAIIVELAPIQPHPLIILLR